MGSLELFWRHLEVNPGSSDTLAGWNMACGDCLAGIIPLLRRTGEIAGGYPSPTPNSPELRVVDHGGRLSAVCDEDPQLRIWLEPDQVALHQIDAASLRKSIAGALGVVTATVRLQPLPGTIHIGVLRPAPTVDYPVVLVAHPDPAHVHVLVREAVQTAKRPVMVLTPTASMWDDQLREWVEDHRCTIVPADEAVEAGNDAAWVATDLWSNFRKRFLHIAGFKAKSVKGNRRSAKPRKGSVIDGHARKLVEVAFAHVQSQQDQVRHFRQTHAKGETVVMPKIENAQLAKEAGCEPFHVSRALKTEVGPVLAKLLHALDDIDALMSFKG